MPKPSQDTLIFCFAQKMFKLVQSYVLDSQPLIKGFAINLRTTQRGHNEQFAYLPLIKSGDSYWMDPAFLGKTSTRAVFDTRNQSILTFCDSLKGLWKTFNAEGQFPARPSGNDCTNGSAVTEFLSPWSRASRDVAI